MLPSVLLAASFYAAPHDTPFSVWGQFAGLPPRHSASGGVYVPVSSSVHIWGDPPNQQPRVVTLDLAELLSKPMTAPPPDPTAERIKAIENVILDLKTRGGSAAVIEQLQHDLDELKAKNKKPK